MRAGRASQHETILRRFERDIVSTKEHGLLGLRFDDVGEGGTIRVDGRVLRNFGNCSYLGLSVDERVKAGAIEAVERYGPLYSSSQGYSALDLYDRLEEAFEAITGAAGVVLPPTTTLGHLACLPVVVGAEDAVLVDSHSHASLQLTTQVLAGRGVAIHPVPHNDMAALSETLSELETRYRKLWYVADGVYSMYGDLVPVDDLAQMLEDHPSLHLYLDDAHGFSWTGLHGRGYVLSTMGWHERLVVVAGLAKSFGTGGALLAFGDPEMAARVRHLGGPMVFAGPIHPPTLGAMAASADIHLSEEHPLLSEAMDHQIRRVQTGLARHGLPAVSWAGTPVWLIRVGEMQPMVEIGKRLLADGFYVNPASFPLVPVGMAGIRFTQTLLNSDDDIDEFLGRLAHHMGEVLGDFEREVDLAEVEGPLGR